MIRQQPTRRQSLLRRPDKRGSEVPLWKLLLLIPTGFMVFFMVMNWINAGVLPEAAIVRKFAVIVIIFSVPITCIAHLATLYVARFRSTMMMGLRLFVIPIVWLASGLLGSGIGIGLAWLIQQFGYITLEPLAANPSVATLLPVFTGNSVVAVAIGLVIAFVRSAKQEELEEQEELLTTEFQAARSVQLSLLPDNEARIAGFDISATMIPAVEIGGDYYDFLSFANGSKGIIVADAAGKGIPAALVMAKFQGMTQALSIHVSNPADLFIGLNDTLRVRLHRRNFITAALLDIDFDDNCTFFRAGHNPLLLFRRGKGSVEELRPAGMALGLAHGAALGNALQPMLFRMEAGDVALITSDGFTEAENAAGEQFGDQRLCDSLLGAGRSLSSAHAIRQQLLADLNQFVAGAQQHDDITIVVVRKMEDE
ncbi:MAG: PP2C family protein-serine/threonine phosphatase [Chlorobi bacterium]|nr:MAG: Serine phosphatase RsbU subunit sigma [Chlorobi bacterium OLB7]MBK8910220.1 PP2C family protein-serine/threonine phosphatase [Chlorobiota bacterium]MBX7217191.1 PP2C family protein-serine/threonine phosphatase [Candidatus Kapabacteria bacterium]